MKNIVRRDFLKVAAVATAAGTLLPGQALAGKEKSTIYVVHGTDVKKMVAAGMKKMGGFKAFVKKDKKATIKANASWESRPEQGGNTDPYLVGECVAACVAAGASEVVVPENIVKESGKSFAVSGIEAAVKKGGGRLYVPEDAHFRKVSLPGGKTLKDCEVVVDVLDTGCLINLPVAKNHSGSVLTLSMKNWMGSVKDRRAWHRGKLDQCIADFSTFIKPNLIIIDATRIMLTNGPRGPGQMAKPNKLIFGVDPVAVDAYAATLFKKEPFQVPHIRIAHEMGIGCGDLGKVKIVDLEVG